MSHQLQPQLAQPLLPALAAWAGPLLLWLRKTGQFCSWLTSLLHSLEPDVTGVPCVGKVLVLACASGCLGVQGALLTVFL